MGATAGPASAKVITPGQVEFLTDGTGQLRPAVQSLVQDGAAVNQLATKSSSLFGRVSGWLTKGFLPTAARVTGLGGLALAVNEVCRSAAAQPGGLECWLYKASPVAGGPGGAVQWSVNQADALQIRWNNDLDRYQVRRQPAGSSSGPSAWANDSVGAWSASTSHAAFPADLEGVWFTYLYIASQGPQYGPTYPTGNSQYYVTNAPNPVPTGFVLHGAPNGDSVWARTDQDGVTIEHKTGANADDPAVPNRALTIPAEVDWAKQMADAIKADPHGGDIADWLQYKLDPGTYEDPTDERPKVLTVEAHETYDQYVARLRSAGVVGTITRVDLTDATMDAERGPNEAVRTSPQAGTRLDPEAEVRVYTNPDTAPEVGEGGEDPDPPVDPGTFSLGPFKVPTPCSVFPFGVPCWTLSFFEKWGSEREAPHFEVPVPFGNNKIVVDASVVDPVAEIARTGLLVLGTFFMAWQFFGLVTGHRMGDD
ncbi:PASTA domain-containing protein [Patulibacter medicamentivorans]|uniref:PASTA domain-containing protein n=1 Tax=Patulibacter medicamentivorans TaxID=1097667 RepID=UPI0014786863|nr:PASTA domain-containing protein [Patulibacter medicamentivorans]